MELKLLPMKTVIWDYNGTIIDDLDLSVFIENEMLKRRGLRADYTRDDYQNLFTFPMSSYYRKIGYTFEHETFEDIAVEFNELYDRYFHMSSLHEGIGEKLEESLRKGYRNVILSSCNHPKLIAQIEGFGLTKYFAEIMGLDDLLAGSKIEIGKQWMEREHVSGEDCIFIGDTTADLETACALQVERCYLVANGHQSYEVLRRVHPQTVHSLDEIIL